jgi:hypothetical protein
MKGSLNLKTTLKKYNVFIIIGKTVQLELQFKTIFKKYNQKDLRI